MHESGNSPAQELTSPTTGRVDDAFQLADGSVRYAEGRKVLFADDDHLSQAGAELVQGRIAGVIAKGCGTQNGLTMKPPSRSPAKRRL